MKTVRPLISFNLIAKLVSLDELNETVSLSWAGFGKIVRLRASAIWISEAVILQLVDEGKLKLDDTIDKYFPHVPNGKNITVRMLGDMSSGLYNYSEDNNP